VFIFFSGEEIMPVYETSSEGGRLSIRLKSHQVAEQDIQDYGAIERSDVELGERARYHVTQMQQYLPTAQAVLADDVAALTSLIEQHYPTIYKGLLVAYTSLQEPFRLALEPRYTTMVNLDDTEDEHPFTGLAGLQALLTKEQGQRRKAAQDDACGPDTYLLVMVQVTIYDAKEADLEWYEKPRRFLCYDLDGDQITRAYEQTDVSDDVLRGLGLPFAETVASATEKE
jgi:hypothetical protein